MMTVDSRQMCPVMSMAEARRVLRIRQADFRRLVDDGVLRTFSRGRARYITDTALRAAIEHLEAAYGNPPGGSRAGAAK